MKTRKFLLLFQLAMLFHTGFAQKAIKVYDEATKRFGVFDLTGKRIMNTEFDKIFYINKSFHCIKKGKQGVISQSGTVIVPIEFDSILYSNCEPPKVYPANKRGKWTVFGSDGKKLSKRTYDLVSAPSDTKIGLKKDDHFVELDIKTGKTSRISQDAFNAFKLDYVECMEISMKGAGCRADIVGENGLYGFKRKGEWIIKPAYESLRFACSFWIAGRNGKYGILSATGEELTGFEYESISPNWNYAIVMKGGKMGVFSVADRKLILKADFNDVTFFE